VAEKKINQIIVFDTRSAAMKIALVGAALAVLAGAFFVARWQFGRMLTETTSSTDRNFQAIADYAVRLAPLDPFAHWFTGIAERSNFLPEAMDKAVLKFENAVRLAPNDYRFWLDLGRAREQAGDAQGAETALRRAVELAPNYSYSHWLLGNFLLRAGKRDAAFSEFRQVAETHSTLRQQVFYLAWENLGDNPAQIEKVVGSAPQVRAALVPFYAAKGKPADALRNWQSLTATEKEEFRTEGETAARVLFDKQNLHAALALLRDLGNERAEIGQIQNASFEGDITNASDSYFGWRTQKLKNVDAARDAAQRKEGRYSLRLTFSGYSDPTLQTATQYIAVEPGARYRLSFWVKTAELKSAGAPLVEISETRSNKILGASKAFTDDMTDWQNVNLEFAAPPEAEAVFLRTGRAFCGDNCPIVGIIWYDEFKLERLGKTGK
jgi:tetratricopeptide (TPR) repeat protein